MGASEVASTPSSQPPPPPGKRPRLAPAPLDGHRLVIGRTLPMAASLLLKFERRCCPSAPPAPHSQFLLYFYLFISIPHSTPFPFVTAIVPHSLPFPFPSLQGARLRGPGAESPRGAAAAQRKDRGTARVPLLLRRRVPGTRVFRSAWPASRRQHSCFCEARTSWPCNETRAHTHTHKF